MLRRMPHSNISPLQTTTDRTVDGASTGMFFSREWLPAYMETSVTIQPRPWVENDWARHKEGVTGANVPERSRY